MDQVEIRLTADEPEAMRVADLLELAFEAEGYVVTREETPAYSRVWTVSALFWDITADDARALVLDRLGGDAFGLEATVQVLSQDTNWIAKSHEVLKPVRAGRFLVHGSHDTDKVRGALVGLRVDARMAFGTGHHATTKGCLEEIDRLLKTRRFFNALDLGTGTGVLAFALARVGKVPVLATDIDPVAVVIAEENARLNEVAPLVACRAAVGTIHRDIRARAPYDLVVANILARPLMRLAPAIRRVSARGGAVLLSGLRVEDVARVAGAYRAQGLRLVAKRLVDGWATLTFKHD